MSTEPGVNPQRSDFWKRKLLAYLHDPPSKCLDLGGHLENAANLMRAAGFSDEEARAYNRPADHTASSADRLPFPSSLSGGLSCTFDGVRARFRHPFGGGELSFHREFASAELAFETDQTIQPVCDVDALPADEQWRARFFAHWRLYSRNALERDYRFDGGRNEGTERKSWARLNRLSQFAWPATF
jgi:CRISPR-associated protein Cmr2